MGRLGKMGLLQTCIYLRMGCSEITAKEWWITLLIERLNYLSYVVTNEVGG